MSLFSDAWESSWATLEAGTPMFACEVLPDEETDCAITLAVIASPLTLTFPPLITVPLIEPAAGNIHAAPAERRHVDRRLRIDVNRSRADEDAIDPCRRQSTANCRR